MTIDHHHLNAFAAILREGSFEKAAQSLSVTPSAISQRIRALEEKMGTVLIIRETPCRPTEEGVKLYRHALQVEMLEKDLLQDMQNPERQSSRSIAVAVNADSLETWFMGAAESFFRETGTTLEIIADDQDHTDQWLKEGRVLGAVTSSSKPVQGCRIERLGIVRYLPMAAPEFAKQYFPKRNIKDHLAQAPMIAFNRKDKIQTNFIKKMIGKTMKVDPPCHFIPSTHAFHDAIAAGLGWGFVIESMSSEYVKKYGLVNFAPGYEMDLILYWQSWRLTSPTLNALTKAVRKAAKDNLA